MDKLYLKFPPIRNKKTPCCNGHENKDAEEIHFISVEKEEQDKLNGSCSHSHQPQRTANYNIKSCSENSLVVPGNCKWAKTDSCSICSAASCSSSFDGVRIKEGVKHQALFRGTSIGETQGGDIYTYFSGDKVVNCPDIPEMVHTRPTIDPRVHKMHIRQIEDMYRRQLKHSLKQRHK